MASDFLSIAIEGMLDADLQRNNTGNVKVDNCDDLTNPIPQWARSPSLQSYLFCWLITPSFMASDFLTIVIEDLKLWFQSYTSTIGTYTYSYSWLLQL